jgi:hypothetical protein
MVSPRARGAGPGLIRSRKRWHRGRKGGSGAGEKSASGADSQADRNQPQSAGKARSTLLKFFFNEL